MKKIITLILNFALPLVLLTLSWNGQVKRWGDALGGIVLITYIVFGFVYGSVYRRGKSRLLYEAVILIGMILYLVVLYKPIEWIGTRASTDFSELGFGTKMLLTFVCVLIIIMRLVGMIVGNNEYKAGSRDRQIRQVESAVEDARARVKWAADHESLHDVEKAKIDLETAKERRDNFFKSVEYDEARPRQNSPHKKSWEE